MLAIRHVTATSLKSFCCYICLFLFFQHTRSHAEEAVGNHSAPILNEIMASNSTTIQDRDGDYPDWIEIYNPGDIQVNLSGYGLSDDPDDPFKWIFPNTTLHPGEVKLIFASDKNYRTESPYLHTNFKINSGGETLCITDNTGVVVDQVYTLETSRDISRGREPDGGDHWVWFSEPTPGNTNSTEWYELIADGPEFSVTGGAYPGGKVLSLSTDVPGASIHYTEDCSEPTALSPVYTSPIQIDETKVIRARVCGSGYLPGSIITHTYLINETLSLPVMCLSTAPENLWDEQVGIYVKGPNAEPQVPYFGANFWQDWERPVHLELFDIDGSSLYSADAGVQIFGGWSRSKPQKSFALFARRDYGPDAFDYPFFPDKSIQTFQALVLRNSGNDWEYSMFRDPLMQSLVSSTSLVVQAYRPVIVFLNGEYWGFYNLREKINEHYIASNYGYDPDNLDILEDDEAVIQGESDHYLQMLNYITSHDMGVPGYYAVLKTYMDVENFIDYQVAEIYYHNTDWPGNNIKFFRPRTEDGLWRWMIFDTDFGFGLYDGYAYIRNTLEFATEPDGPAYPNPPWSTLLLRRLLKNTEFRNSFINRFADHMNTIFSPDEVIDRIDSLKANIDQEMENHFARWGGDVLTWQNEVESMREFARLRNGYIREHLIEKFNLEAIHKIRLDVKPENAGTITVNTVVPDRFPWEGTYFQNVPVLLTANADYGFQFAGWDGDIQIDSNNLPVNLTGDFSVTAIFEPAVKQIVINEINYNASQDVNPEDWVELYNNRDFPVDVTGWKLKDAHDDHVFTIPNNTTLNRDAYLVICRDSTAFKGVFPDVVNVIGSFDFGFDANGELLRLYDSSMNMVDSLIYDDRFPWPVEPDGNGPTLALKNPNLDNALAESWAASDGYGTPGKINDVYTGVSEDFDAVTAKVPHLFQNYPNPFNNMTRIAYSLEKSGHVTLTLLDLLGREIKTLADEYQEADSYSIEFDAEGLPSGVYFYRLRAGQNSVITKKMLLMR